MPRQKCFRDRQICLKERTRRMKIPANETTRLNTQTWIEGEAWRRFTNVKSVRKAIEALVQNATTDAMNNPEFMKVWKEVRSEGINGKQT